MLQKLTKIKGKYVTVLKPEVKYSIVKLLMWMFLFGTFAGVLKVL